MSRLAVLSLALLALAPAARAADVPGRIGPDLKITGNGRQLHPIGDLTTVGNFPTGSALTPDARYLWVVDSGHGKNDVKVVNVRSGKVVQTLPLPGAFGGVAFTPDGTRAFVSGTPAGDTKRDGPLKGGQGDVIHVFDVDPRSGQGIERDPVVLPAQSGGSGQNNSLPPVSKLYPSTIAVAPDGTVGVVESQADRVAFFPAKGGEIATVKVGRYPNGLVFDRDGRAFVSNAWDGTVSVLAPHGGVARTIDGLGGINSQPEGMVLDPRGDRLYVAVTQRDTVAVIDTTKLEVVKTVSVGRREAIGTQPVALAVDPDGQTLYAANSNEDTVAAVALRDRPASASSKGRRTVYRPPSVNALNGYATSRLKGSKRRALHDRLLRTARVKACAGPSRAQARAYRAAVLRALRGPKVRRAAALKRATAKLPVIRPCASDGAIPGLKAYDLIGKLPTAAYPSTLQATSDRLIWVAAKGFGAGANPGYVSDGAKEAFGKIETVYGQYVADRLIGRVGRLSLPTDRQTRSMLKAAEDQAVPTNHVDTPPAGTPVRSGGPIKHVFYIVRENRTYDQIFGSDPRGDGDPKLQIFDDNGVKGPTGGITPNAHALARTFPLLDHVYADSEVSVDGHLITGMSLANDYVQKGTAQNYSRDGKSFDMGIYPITYPPKGPVFDQAVRQNVTFRNYGELAAGNTPLTLLAGDRRPEYAQVQANTDLAYPNNVQIGCLTPGGAVGNLAACAQDSGVLGTGGSLAAADSRVNEFQAVFAVQDATGTVPTFNYLILPNDHTNGTKPNTYTTQAFTADNDLGLGQIVDIISHSSIWESSAIFVIEDDSQDGADHVDAHRMPAFVISPWAKRGAVVHTRYDQYSVLRTAEILAGLQPLSINDALATPMYDAFDTKADVEGTRFRAITPEQSLTELNTASSAFAALSAALPFERLDMVPQALVDRILWASVHGESSTPPQPGPNASPIEHERAVGALRVLAAGGDARRWLLRHDSTTVGAGDAAAAVNKQAGNRAVLDPDDVSVPTARTPEARAGLSTVKLPAAVRRRAAAEARRVLAELG